MLPPRRLAKPTRIRRSGCIPPGSHDGAAPHTSPHRPARTSAWGGSAGEMPETKREL